MGFKKILLSIPPLKAWMVRKSIARRSEELSSFLVDLTPLNIKNLRVLNRREDLLKQLPKNGVVAEIGVDTGDFSNLILENANPKRLHLIDAWATSRYDLSKENSVRRRFSGQVDSGLVQLHKGYSTAILPSFPDKYFDWVYLDSGHGFKLTLQELETLNDKVKDGGIISGHDYCRFSHRGEFRFGVVEAVNWFCVHYNYEFLFLTMETHRHLSFAIRKIRPELI